MKPAAAIVLVLSCTLARAEEQTIPQWRDELAQAYQRNGGYVAHYGMSSPEGTAIYTFANEPVTGIAVAEEQLQWKRVPNRGHLWYPGGDELFSGDPTSLIELRGVRTEVRGLSALAETLGIAAPRAGGPSHQLTAAFLYQGGPFLMHQKIVSAVHGPWHEEIARGTVKTWDAESVTFQCYSHGEITISRRNGLLTRAVSELASGRTSVKLIELIPDATAEMIKARFPVGLKITAVHTFSRQSLRERLDLYQLLVDRADEGSLATDAPGEAKLQAALDEQRGALQLFADGCISKVDPLQKTAGEFSAVSIFRRRLVAKTPAGERLRAILEATMVRACADGIAQRRMEADRK